MAGSGFGSPFILEKSLAAWACRAIFKPYTSKGYSLTSCLYILWDRQGGLNIEGDDNELWKKMQPVINKDILPQLQKWASHFTTNSSEVLVKHFICPWDEKLIFVAHGSPNGSCGYFYIAVCLMTRQDAPPDKKTEEEIASVRRKELQKEFEERERQRNILEAEQRKATRARNKVERAKIAALFENAPVKHPGDHLEVGDQVQVEANQNIRDALVRAVCDDEAVVEYWMPNCRSFLRIIRVDNHGMVRTLSSMSKLPKKWNCQPA